MSRSRSRPTPSSAARRPEGELQAARRALRDPRRVAPRRPAQRGRDRLVQPALAAQRPPVQRPRPAKPGRLRAAHGGDHGRAQRQEAADAAGRCGVARPQARGREPPCEPRQTGKRDRGAHLPLPLREDRVRHAARGGARGGVTGFDPASRKARPKRTSAGARDVSVDLSNPGCSIRASRPASSRSRSADRRTLVFTAAIALQPEAGEVARLGERETPRLRVLPRDGRQEDPVRRDVFGTSASGTPSEEASAGSLAITSRPTRSGATGGTRWRPTCGAASTPSRCPSSSCAGTTSATLMTPPTVGTAHARSARSPRLRTRDDVPAALHAPPPTCGRRRTGRVRRPTSQGALRLHPRRRAGKRRGDVGPPRARASSFRP